MGGIVRAIFRRPKIAKIMPNTTPVQPDPRDEESRVAMERQRRSLSKRGRMATLLTRVASAVGGGGSAAPAPQQTLGGS